MNRFNLFNNGNRCNEDMFRDCNQNKTNCRENEDCSCNTNCEQCPEGQQGPRGPRVQEIERTGPSSFNLAGIGTYQIFFQVSVDEAGQLNKSYRVDFLLSRSLQSGLRVLKGFGGLILSSFRGK